MRLQHKNNPTKKVTALVEAVTFCLETKFPHQMRTVLHSIHKGFAFIVIAQPAAEGENGVVVIQGEGREKLFQFPEPILNLRRVGLVGFGIGLVKLIQDGGTFLVTGVQGMGLNIGSKALQELFHSGTSKKFW
jgi:hypothetical protein